jgi:hypothetical protein
MPAGAPHRYRPRISSRISSHPYAAHRGISQFIHPK